MAQVPAADQVLGILSYLGQRPRPVAAASIARDLELPRSTTYHLLNALLDKGFVVHVPEDRRYALGVAAYELGTGYSRQAPLARLARMPLTTLVDRAGQNAHLAVLHGREVIYVIEERAPGRQPLVTDVGVRLPAQLTASGRAMLAALSRQQVTALFPDPSAFVLRNDRGPRSLSALRQLLIQVRRRGFATEDGEVTEHFSSVAAVIRDHGGHPVASVAITFDERDIDESRRGYLAGHVVRTAASISRRLGG
ncbi:MAG TPA: IclR family transcriptional regulator [Jatrophihabitans sp.]|jgi:DNA-binding IclR family transcriptional regulator